MAFVESEVVELKAEVVGDICKEVIAFANTKGGTLYIGVSDDGSVVGVKNADQVILQLNNMGSAGFPQGIRKIFRKGI